jgi:hypothetical protein
MIAPAVRQPSITVTDAILDRLVHTAYRLDLDGPSMRKAQAGDGTQQPRP